MSRNWYKSFTRTEAGCLKLQANEGSDKVDLELTAGAVTLRVEVAIDQARDIKQHLVEALQMARTGSVRPPKARRKR